MFVSKEHYIKMENRIEQLENLICPPDKGHDFVEVDDYNGFDIWTGKCLEGKRYQCARCLKKKFVSF